MDPIKIIDGTDSDDLQKQIKSEIWYFLNKANKMILAYKNSMGEVVQSLMLYIIDDDFNFYFGTLRRFAKYEFLIQNPPISMVVTEQEAEPEKYVSVKAVVEKVIDDPEEISQIFQMFKNKNTCKYYIKDAEDFVIFKAKALSLRMISSENGVIIRQDLPLV